jgi:hypothetical protein
MQLVVMIGTKISSAQALIADGRAIAKMLDEVPEANEIRAELSRPYFIRRWQHRLSPSSNLSLRKTGLFSCF